MPPARAAASSRSTNTSTRATPATWRCPKPSETERGQWYFQRYVVHLPTAGEIVLYDRSWYNRAGVEPVMGFCTPEQQAVFLDTVPRFEKMLVKDGIVLFKFWLEIGRDHAAQAVLGAAARSAEDLEAVVDRLCGDGEVGRLHRGARRHVRGERPAGGAVDGGARQ